MFPSCNSEGRERDRCTRPLCACYQAPACPIVHAIVHQLTRTDSRSDLLFDWYTFPSLSIGSLAETRSFYHCQQPITGKHCAGRRWMLSE